MVTRLKLAPDAAADDGLTEEEKTRGAEFAGKLPLRVLARTWQMLLKGIEETREASRPLAAADMVLVRIAHAADLPTPDEAIRAIRDGATEGGRPASAPSGQASAGGETRTRLAAVAGASPAAERAEAPRLAAAPEPALRLAAFADLVALAGESAS